MPIVLNPSLSPDLCTWPGCWTQLSGVEYDDARQLKHVSGVLGEKHNLNLVNSADISYMTAKASFVLLHSMNQGAFLRGMFN